MVLCSKSISFADDYTLEFAGVCFPWGYTVKFPANYENIAVSKSDNCHILFTGDFYFKVVFLELEVKREKIHYYREHL